MRRYFVLLATSFFLANLMPHEGLAANKFDDHFKKLQEIRISTKGLHIAQFWELCADTQGHIYVLDPKGCQVLMFDNTGGFIRRIGGPGEGPGEYRLPRTMCTDFAGNVYVIDGQTRRLSKFDDKGSFLTSYILAAHHMIVGIRIGFSGEYFIAGLSLPTTPRARGFWLSSYNSQKHFVRSFFEDNLGTGWTFRMNPNFAFDVHRDQVYATQINEYKIHVFDPSGMLVNTIDHHPDYFRAPDAGYTFDESKYSSLESLRGELIRVSNSWTRIIRLEVLDDDTFIVQSIANGLIKNFNNIFALDIWSLDGRLKASAIPTDYKFLFSDKAGNCYFLIYTDEESALDTDPNFVIGKYRFIANGK